MRRKLLSALCALCAAALPLFGGEEIALGEKDFRLGRFSVDGGTFSVSHDKGVFTVEIPEQPGISNETRGAILDLPLEKLLGKGLQIRCEIRCRGIETVKGNPHSGGKILVYNSKAKVKNFFVSPRFKGTRSEWVPLTLFCNFPADIDDAQIVFGIQQGWGTLQFRNVSIEEFPIAPVSDIVLPEGFKCEYTSRVLSDVPRRGVMSPVWPQFTEDDIRELAAWNVNLVRYQIVGGCPDVKNIAVYRKWFNDALAHLEKLMPLLKKHDIKVIVDMHHVLGGRYGKDAAVAKADSSHFRIMHETEYRDAFIKIWQETARRFKGNPQIYAYDLCNEPIQHGTVPYSFWDLQYDAAKAIRSVDPEVPVMVESNHMASPVFFEMLPMPLSNIIYSIHMYAPGEYTHQGVGDLSYIKTYYARRFDYRDAGWNRSRLAESMKSVRKFQQKYGAKIQAGEFSVAVWAPGGAGYLDELISIFEEYKWDWTYHAFREWEGWSLEHEGSPDKIRKAEKDTDRKQVLLKYFKQNKKR